MEKLTDIIKILFCGIKNIFKTTISDEEIAEGEWVQCPNCQTNVAKEVLEDKNWFCPICHKKIQKEE